MKPPGGRCQLLPRSFATGIVSALFQLVITLPWPLSHIMSTEPPGLRFLHRFEGPQSCTVKIMDKVRLSPRWRGSSEHIVNRSDGQPGDPVLRHRHALYGTV
jgi:hypothetical protein